MNTRKNVLSVLFTAIIYLITACGGSSTPGEVTNDIGSQDFNINADTNLPPDQDSFNQNDGNTDQPDTAPQCPEGEEMDSKTGKCEIICAETEKPVYLGSSSKICESCKNGEVFSPAQSLQICVAYVEGIWFDDEDKEKYTLRMSDDFSKIILTNDTEEQTIQYDVIEDGYIFYYESTQGGNSIGKISADHNNIKIENTNPGGGKNIIDLSKIDDLPET